MIWFKSCPRCQRGDVILDRDIYSWYVQCLQCGYMKDLENSRPIKVTNGWRPSERALQLV